MCSWKTAGAIFIAVLALGAGLAFYMGVFYSPTFKDDHVKSKKVVITEVIGDYQHTIPETWTGIMGYLKKANWPDSKPLKHFGVYYDDPNGLVEGEEKKMRMAIGFEPRPEDVQALLDLLNKGDIKFKEVHLPPVKVVIGDFPYRNNFSFMLAAMKMIEPLCLKVIEKPEYKKKVWPLEKTAWPSKVTGIVETLEGNRIVYYMAYDDEKFGYMINEKPAPKYKDGYLEEYEKKYMQ